MAIYIQRRRFLASLGGAAVSWPLAARAQQSAMPVIGFLSAASADLYGDRVRAFQQGLRETGHVEGRNVAIEYRWADGQADRLPALAADLVRRQVSVIAVDGTSTIGAAKAATTTIPIVFSTGIDPVEAGLVASLNHPGGNLTGVSNLNAQLGPKRLELVHELVPNARLIALLLNPTNSLSKTIARDLEAAGLTRGINIHILQASTERELDMVLPSLDQLHADALVFCADLLFIRRSDRLAALALRHSLPAISQFREFAAAGGLMSYGSSLADAYRLVGVYAGRILMGEKAGDLPVQQATKVELVLNLKTAKALGLTVPNSLLARADELIE
jgi:putative ABC transport system substrate-binding protein